MIQVCPNCGSKLLKPLIDGLSQCDHCNQLFDSSNYYLLLSAAWEVRKFHLTLEQIKKQLKLDNDLAVLVYVFVSEYGYTHEDFIHFLKKLKVK